jgi:GT2 family glycosyltransferase
MVSIITVNYNQAAVTFALLDSIRRQDYKDIEVFVVDNASKENPQAAFETQYPEVHFIRSEVNLGFAGGNNLAVRAAKGDYLFFINNDAELTDHCLERLVAMFDNNPKLGLVSPLICYYPQEKWTEDFIQYAGMTPIHPLTARNETIGKKTWERGQYTEPRATAYAHGAAMMCSNAVIEQAGMMDEDFFLYYEELDWGERVRKSGFEIWVEPRARVYHKESLTVGKLGSLKTYYLNRNRVWFMHRNYGGWKIAAFYIFLFLVTIPKNTLQMLLKGEKDNLKAFWRGIFWNFSLKDPEKRMSFKPA